MFKLYPTSILDVFVIQPNRNTDPRGDLYELFNERVFPLNTKFDIKQVTYSTSKRGTIRGFHVQPGMSKVMMVLKGHAILSTVDIRPSSPSYKQIVNVPINAKNELKMVYAPDWAARGFIALEDDTTILYFQDGTFNRELSVGFNWASPEVEIKPWVYSGIDPHDYVISDKDKVLPMFSDFENPFARAIV